MRRFKRCVILVVLLAVVLLIVHVLVTVYAVLCMAWLFFYIISL